MYQSPQPTRLKLLIYHVFYDEKEKVENKKAYYFLSSDKKMDSYDGSAQRFFGCANRNMIPEAVRRGFCSNIDFEGDSDFFLAAAQHRIKLNANEKSTFHIIIGTAATKEEISEFIKNLDIDVEWQALQEKWKK